MKPFLNEEFLLQSDPARRLYHDYAEHLPIIDYHCHIDPAAICADKQYDTITEIWLGGDHYKWRAMRACGVPERCVTGDAAPEEKFQKWAETLPGLIGNPLYHWSHLELKRYFGVEETLNGSNAMEIYRHCNAMLAKPELSVRGIIRQSSVKAICTTDDPVDDLHSHEQLAADKTAPALVLPAFRPDKAMRADKAEFAPYVKKLEAVVGYSIDTMESMRRALRERIAYFAAHGCRVSDHALDFCFCEFAPETELDAILQKAKRGETITQREQLAYHTALLIAVGQEYCQRGWVMQLHFGCLRNNSTRMFRALGPDSGFDSMNDMSNAAGLARLLDALDQADALGKTVLYSLNPMDNGVIESVMGCFQADSGMSGKLQHGSAWWYNDNKRGMEEQLQSLMNVGTVCNFVGMLTDSRSFLSYTRHEYFRRILCNLFGQYVENGEYPADWETLGKLVQDISYYNALRYLGLESRI